MRPIYGCSEKFRAFLTTLTATITEIFFNVLINPMTVRIKFDTRSFTCS